MTRIMLMIVVPLIVAVVGLRIYVGGGRYVVTENAYLKAHIIVISADVSGRVVRVNVDDNQPVRPGEQLFAIDPLPFRIAVAEADAQLEVVRTDIGQLHFDVREAPRAQGGTGVAPQARSARCAQPRRPRRRPRVTNRKASPLSPRHGDSRAGVSRSGAYRHQGTGDGRHQQHEASGR
jgi:multidrug resistance efflux pump